MSKRKQNLPVLVPVDFSAASANALVWAADMAACWKAPLVILHVVHDLGEAPGYYAVKGRKKQLQRMEDVAAEMLDGFHKEMVAKHRDFASIKHATLKLVVGLPVNRILEVVEETDSQLVVMGSQGRTGLGHLLLGSKAEQIVRLCPVPVTIVKYSEQT
jgi:nucleotide-binding universal stress UspA family protein